MTRRITLGQRTHRTSTARRPRAIEVVARRQAERATIALIMMGVGVIVAGLAIMCVPTADDRAVLPLLILMGMGGFAGLIGIVMALTVDQ